jgi:hypothetical protein
VALLDGLFEHPAKSSPPPFLSIASRLGLATGLHPIGRPWIVPSCFSRISRSSRHILSHPLCFTFHISHPLKGGVISQRERGILAPLKPLADWCFHKCRDSTRKLSVNATPAPSSSRPPSSRRIRNCRRPRMDEIRKKTFRKITWPYVVILAGRHRGLILYR